MKKKRSIAFILCLAMVISLIPVLPIHALGDTNFDVVNENGAIVESVVLPQYEKVKLTASGVQTDGYQWQILAYNTVWVNISGATQETLELSYAMVASLLNDNGAATIRCLSDSGMESKEIAVTVNYNAVPETSAAAAEPVVLSEAEAVVGPVVTPPAETEAPVVETEAPAVVEEPVVAAEPVSAGEEEEVVTEEQTVMTFSAFSEARTLAADGDIKQEYNIIVNFLFENNEIAADPITSTVTEGYNFSLSVKLPVVQGYLPYINDVQQGETYDLNYASVDQDHTINVVYKPTNVNYTVIHYQQNVDNDKYTIALTETKQGLTNSIVPDVAGNYEGFYALLYEKPAIAADGSTVVEVYYDRAYVLISFDLDGGYGVEPIYARYGAPISVNDPTKAGYAFSGWSPELAATVPAENMTYTAVWGNAQTVNYTVVYWKENADDSNYSFWGSEIKQAVAGSTVSGSDDIPTSISTSTVDGSSLNEKPYFTYNDAKTDKNVVIAGDGSTVVNVYYYRNVYTVYFRGISGQCVIEEHTHGDNCNSVLNCSFTEHVHDDTCVPTLTCQIEEHTHSELCCTVSTDTHTHTTSCYNNVNVDQNVSSDDLVNAPENPVDGLIYRRGKGYNRLIYISGTWYRYSQSDVSSDTIIQPNNNCPGTHTHGDGNCSCPLAAHTHTDSCYSYSCGYVAHTHNSGCYRECTKLEHTHTANCTKDSNDNVIYVVTAKYEQTIGDIWPTAENFPNVTFSGWKIDGINSTAVSKRVNMTADLCDTSDGLKYAAAVTGGSTTYLYYMFESFDQTSAANGNERILRNGVYYDKSDLYYQEVNSGGSWSQKEIYGMDPVSNGVVTSGSNVFLYYTRNRWTLSYQNVDTVVKTVSNIMFEQPLVNYKDSDGNLLSAFTPSYPSTLEPNAYEFEGWYTTPECYAGTKFDFSTAVMPNSNLTLYANWVPVTHTVEFYLTQDAMNAGTKLSTHPDLTVSHGSKVSVVPADPTNGSYTFVGWFYMDGNTEKAIDFANMPINKDIKVYAKWSSNVLKQYFVYYKYVDADGNEIEIADVTEGSALAGITKTFDAKGGSDLYSGYQEGYFPTTKSHSMTIDIENDANNSFTFWYVAKDAVPYTVKYLNKATGESVAAEKVVEDNRKAVVTETFVVVSGMLPDAYQKTLVVNGSDGAVNEIIFYYTEDTDHAYYKVTHYTQNTDGATWTEYASSQTVGDIGTTYTADPVTIDGFTFDSTVEGTVQSGELTASGLELKLYYTRNQYPYMVRYLEEGTADVLHEPTVDSDIYGKVISVEALAIDGYECISTSPQTLTIKIESDKSSDGVIDVNDVNLNIVTFYYREQEVTINYQVEGPDGCGVVKLTNDSTTATSVSETVKIKSEDAEGAVAAASSNVYRFVGWYNEAGEMVSDELNFVPEKVAGKNIEATYTAKFEYNLTKMTITKMLTTTSAKDESFVFTVTGGGLTETMTVIVKVPAGSTSASVTIDGLTVGESVSVMESGFNRDYTQYSSNGTIILGVSDNTVYFTNQPANNQWLSESAHEANQFVD